MRSFNSFILPSFFFDGIPFKQRYQIFLRMQNVYYPISAYAKIGLMLILASGSPRRHGLLSLFGVHFRVHSTEIDERVVSGESPQDYVLRLAISKSLSINPLSAERLVVIAADTAVLDGDQILGKPGSQQQAIQMLSKLRDRTHTVLSGLAVRDTKNDEILTDLCSTQVQMRDYEETEIREYVAGGDPMDKAGAYAIQNSGFAPVAQITGCYANVVGLPLCHLARLFNRLGVPYQEEAVRGCWSDQTYSCRLVEKITAMDADDQ
jgi:MAF protein